MRCVERRPASMRILLVAPLPPPPGGIATWTEGLLRFALHDSKVEIVHVSSSVRYRAAADLRVATRIIGGLCHGVSLFSKFAAVLLFKHIDVVHITTSGSFGMCRDIVMLTFARFLRIPSVLHVRFGRIPEVAASENWEAVLIRRTCRVASCVIVLDSASAATLRAVIPGCSVSMIPNPAWKLAEAPATPTDYEQGKVIVFVGWVIPGKGIRELVLACRDIQDTAFRLDMIGPVEEDFRRELQEVAHARDGGEWLKISGQVESEEALARMARGFAIVLPSYTEGFPNVVLEAMMLGKPVIATPVGAIPQMLSDGGAGPCGICVPVGDVNALRMAIQSLLKQPAYAHQLGRRGKERVALEYSPQAVYSQYKLIWEKSAISLKSSS
jgi:glycosyltransferase involved in cell wall biosynthesis